MDQVLENEEKTFKVQGFNILKNSSFKDNFFIIGISIGSDKFTKKPLLALIEAINKLFYQEKVTYCVFAVADTLQRHNYRIDGKITEKKALEMSQRAGDLWINENKEIFDRLKVPHKLTRWETWRKAYEKDKTFQENFYLFSSSPIYKSARLKSIHEYSFRFRKRYLDFKNTNSIDEHALEKHCGRYLDEEAAILMQMWPEYKEDACQRILYPAKMTDVLACAYQHFVEKKYQFSWINFSLRSSKYKTRLYSPLSVNLTNSDSSENLNHSPFFSNVNYCENINLCEKLEDLHFSK